MGKVEKINQSKTPIVGKNIECLRMKNSMRNVDVVTRLQLEGVIISTSTLSKIERGYTNPTVETLIALTDIFKCDFNAFFQQVQEEQYFCLGGITIKGTYSHKLKGMWYDVESLL